MKMKKNVRNANLHLTVMRHILLIRLHALSYFYVGSLASLNWCKVVNVVIGQTCSCVRQGLLDETAPGWR